METPVRTFPELETARLRLRQITIDDLDWFMRHFSIPEICHGQGYPPPAGLDTWRSNSVNHGRAAAGTAHYHSQDPIL